MIPKAVLERKDIPFPDFDTQGSGVTIHALEQHENSLSHELAKRREQLLSLVLTERTRLAYQHENAQLLNGSRNNKSTRLPRPQTISSWTQSTQDNARTTFL